VIKNEPGLEPVPVLGLVARRLNIDSRQRLQAIGGASATAACLSSLGAQYDQRHAERCHHCRTFSRPCGNGEMKHWFPQERWCAHFTMAAAARLRHAKSQHLATDDEIQTAEDEAKRLAFHEGLRKRGIAVIAVPGDAERLSGLR
jgi:hypothetical protein